jgi:hypothetical protein
MKKSDFFRNLVPICLTAFIGTVISSSVVGYGLYVYGRYEARAP